MKKRITLLAVSALCAVSAVAGAAATEVIREIKAELRPDFTIEVDGEKKEFKNAQGEDVYPILYEGTTYLPIRAIGELMGKTVYWYEDDKRIELVEKKEPTVTDADVIVDGSDSRDKQYNEKDKIKDGDKDKVKDNNKDKAKDKEDKVITSDSGNFIGHEKAKDIAIEKAGLKGEKVGFGKTELDYDNGTYEYDIEFKCGGIEYEFEIDAVSGEIIRWEKDRD